MFRDHDAPDLDDRLERSVPPTSEVADLDPAIADLVAQTRVVARRDRIPRRAGVAATAAVVVIAASGTAAATGFGGWATPWGHDPDGAIAFTLPSGGTCEYRIGNLEASEDGVADEVRAWLDDHTLAEIADVERSIQKQREGPNHAVLADGTQIEVGYGTAHYDADHEYATAVEDAIGHALHAKAQELGLGGRSAGGAESGFGMAGEIQCDGANPNPLIPSWQR